MFNADTNQCHNKKGDLISQIPQCIMNSRKVFRCKIWCPQLNFIFYV